MCNISDISCTHPWPIMDYFCSGGIPMSHTHLTSSLLCGGLNQSRTSMFSHTCQAITCIT